MPQFLPVVLTDRAPTPVDHTFVPRDVNGGIATLVESSGIPIGDKKLTLSQTRSQNGRIRVSMKMTIPVVQNAEIAGVTKPTVVRTSYADLVLNFDSSSSLRERDDVVAFLHDLLKRDDNPVGAYIVDLEGMY